MARCTWILCATLALGCSDVPEPMDAGVDAGLDLDGDFDGDGISNRDEGIEQDRNSDDDRAPDYKDPDSDNNGIPDATEGPDGDFDRDGVPDYADTDDDDDLAPDAAELMGQIDPPADSDGDGAPDYQDPDSDNDLILDGHELGADTDGDGLLDQHDLDSDGDGISDADEAGDDDLYSPPVDSDGDLIPDFRDTDSDNDGLEDAVEQMLGTSPTREDTDGDGVSDWIEVEAGTDPTDPADAPMAMSGSVVVVYYCDPPDPSPLEVRFELTRDADAYLAFEPTDPEAATFFESVEADPSGSGCTLRTRRDWDGDGVPETFMAARAGDTLCFSVRSVMNDVRRCDGPYPFRGDLVLRDRPSATELGRQGLHYLDPGYCPGPGGPEPGSGC